MNQTETQDCPDHRTITRPGADRVVAPKPRGESAWKEAATLMDRLEFSTERGVFVTGKEVAIYIGPECDDLSGQTVMIVTCHAYGSRVVDWNGPSILVVQADNGRTVNVCFLKEHGHGRIEGLARGEYRLDTSLVFGCWKDAPVPRRDCAIHEVYGRSIPPKALGGELAAPESWFAMSSDGRVCATVRPKGGRTVVAFETKEACLVGALVRFAIATQSGHTVHAGEVRLEAHETEPAIWEGRWIGTLTVDEPCDLIFHVHPVT